MIKERGEEHFLRLSVMYVVLLLIFFSCDACRPNRSVVPQNCLGKKKQGKRLMALSYRE